MAGLKYMTGDPARNIALLAWAVGVALLTLSPAREAAGDPLDPWCIVCGARGLGDALLNVTLFVPLGLLLGGKLRGYGWALLLGASIAGVVELLQLVLPGRYPTAGDVVWNAVGTAIGQGLSHALVWGATEGPTAAGPAVRAPALLLAMALLAGGALLAPAPPDADYFAQWTPDLRSMPAYGGELVAAAIDGRSVPRSRFPPAWPIRDELAGDWRFDGVVVKGSPPSSVSPVFSIYDGRQREVLLVGADGDDLVLRERLLAAAARLDAPDVRMVGGLGHVAVGDTVAISLWRTGSERCFRVDAREACEAGFGLGRLWGLLLYVEGPGARGRALFDVIWLALLMVPIGYASGLGRALWGNLAIVASGAALAVALTRLTWSPPLELAGLVAGAAFGVALNVVARRLLGLPARPQLRPSPPG